VDDLFPEVVIQIHGCSQVDSPATQQSAELALDVCQAKKTDMGVRPELDQHVDITGFGKPIRENRAKESQLMLSCPASPCLLAPTREGAREATRG